MNRRLRNYKDNVNSADKKNTSSRKSYLNLTKFLI